MDNPLACIAKREMIYTRQLFLFYLLKLIWHGLSNYFIDENVLFGGGDINTCPAYNFSFAKNG
jgi:hypothetical protein